MEERGEAVSARKEVLARWYAKLISDPKRKEARLEWQRQRRASKKVQEQERADARERWAMLPPDHPRKRRKPTRKPETVKAKRKRDLERLPDSVVANRFLRVHVGDCPKEIIEIKRQHIKLSRLLGVRIKSL